jgi:hypothetical protein
LFACLLYIKGVVFVVSYKGLNVILIMQFMLKAHPNLIGGGQNVNKLCGSEVGKHSLTVDS